MFDRRLKFRPAIFLIVQTIIINSITKVGAAEKRQFDLLAKISEMVLKYGDASKAPADVIVGCLSASFLRYFVTHAWLTTLIASANLSSLFKVVSLDKSEADVVMMFMLFHSFVLLDGDVKFVLF